MSFPEALERAADALSAHSDAIRDANGDPHALFDSLQRTGGTAVTDVAVWMLANEPEDADELLAALADSDEGAQAIASIDASALPKAGRKQLRRALHSLRSRGAELPSAPAPAPRVAKLPELEEAVAGAFALPLDPRGARAVLLIDPQPGGTQSKIYEVVIDDVRGIVDFASYEAGRSRVRAFVKQLSKRTRGAAIAIEPAEARALIAGADARQAAERPAPRAFEDHRSRLRLGEAGSERPGDRARRELADAEGEPDRSQIEAACELARVGRIGPWPPALEGLRELADGFKERVEGRVIVSGATQRDRVDGAIGDTAAEIYDETFSAITAERLRESAYIFWQSDDEEAARTCLAAARSFETLAPTDNPLARTLTELLLGPALGALTNETDDSEPDVASADDGSDDEPVIVPG